MTERTRCARFGFVALLVWASAGLCLEAAHGLKLAPYLDDGVARLLLTLAHAHGAGLALVVLAHGAVGAPLFPTDDAARVAGRLLRAAALLVPLGFLLGVIGHGESDPSPAVLLVPVGALSLLAGLALDARAAFRSDRS